MYLSRPPPAALSRLLNTLRLKLKNDWDPTEGYSLSPGHSPSQGHSLIPGHSQGQGLGLAVSAMPDPAVRSARTKYEFAFDLR